VVELGLPPSAGTGLKTGAGTPAESRKNFTPAADAAKKMMNTMMEKQVFVAALRMYSRQIHFTV